MVNSPDMFREMEFAWKAAGGGRLDPRQILCMATSNAGRILDRRLGIIQEGAAADYILVDTDHVDISPMHDPYAAMVHRISAASIRMVSVNGDIVHEQA